MMFRFFTWLFWTTNLVFFVIHCSNNKSSSDAGSSDSPTSTATSTNVYTANAMASMYSQHATTYPTVTTTTDPNAISSDGSTTSTDGTNLLDPIKKIPFSSVNSILQNHCGGAACHGDGTQQDVYYDDEDRVGTDKEKIISILDANPAEPPHDKLKLTPADTKQLLDYLKQD